MMYFGGRPTEGRDGFESRAREHTTNLRELLDEQGEPDIFRIKKYIDANQLWSSGVKNYFHQTQHSKCGFCEVIITAETGAVDHFRPKKRVTDLEATGEEIENSSNVRNRKEVEISPIGYWWMAYLWDNFLLTCNRCNSSWKRSLFPVVDRSNGIPRENENEAALLIDPFEDAELEARFLYTDLGTIEARNGDCFASATIETCGLDRESLRNSREEKAKSAHQKINQLIDLEEAANARVRDLLKEIYDQGNASYRHSGMIRSIFQERTGFTWKDLEEMQAVEDGWRNNV